MYARALQEAEAQLVELRKDERSQVALSVAALAASLAATSVSESFVLPLFVGGVVLGMLGIHAMWRRWDLVDRLADDRDAYDIPAVRAYAARDARMDRRLGYAALIRSRVRQPWPSDRARLLEFADELDRLAHELADSDLELDPACALACRRLLCDPTVSPLLNNALPCEDVRPYIARIRAGFRAEHRTG